MKKFIAIMMILQFCSCEDIIEKDIRNGHVSIIAPHQNASAPEGKVKFAWNKLDGARSYHFTLVAPSFDNAVSLVADTIIPRDTTGRALYVNVDLSYGKYQWRVVAQNASYQSESDMYNFHVVAPRNEEN